MCLWPGLALMSLQYIPEFQDHWLMQLNGTIIFLAFWVVFAACAIYWSFLTEVLPFPTRLGEAIALTVTLPAHIVLMLLTSNQTVWEILVVGFIMESVVIYIPIIFLVVEKMRTDWNTFAAVVLLGATGTFIAIAAPLMYAILERSWWTYAIVISGVVSGSIQTVMHYRYSARTTVDTMGYILIGVAGFFVLLFVPTIIKAITEAL